MKVRSLLSIKTCSGYSNIWSVKNLSKYSRSGRACFPDGFWRTESALLLCFRQRSLLCFWFWFVLFCSQPDVVEGVWCAVASQKEAVVWQAVGGERPAGLRRSPPLSMWPCDHRAAAKLIHSTCDQSSGGRDRQQLGSPRDKNRTAAPSQSSFSLFISTRQHGLRNFHVQDSPPLPQPDILGKSRCYLFHLQRFKIKPTAVRDGVNSAEFPFSGKIAFLLFCYLSLCA